METIDIVKADLGANYNEEDNLLLVEKISEITKIASDITNNLSDDLKPYIATCVESWYLARGAEGQSSRSEGSISSSYIDAIQKMKTDLISAGKRRIK